MTDLNKCTIQVEVHVFHSEKWISVLEWLKQNVDHNCWRYIGIKNSLLSHVRVFQFAHQPDATLFALRWS